MPQCWDRWVPGVLSKGQLVALCESDVLRNARPDAVDDQSSIDLRLSDEAYELRGGSVKPFGPSYLAHIKNAGLVTALPAAADGTYTLAPRRTYLFRLRETIHAAMVGQGALYGQATAKSSVGRVDVLARLIVDGMTTYEEFTPKEASLGNGDLFLEITPMTFSVVVKSDISLTQLRIFRGRPDAARVRGREVCRILLPNASESDGTLSVDLSNATEVRGRHVATFRAKKSPSALPVRLWTGDGQIPPDPSLYWLPEAADEGLQRLRIEPDEFYILRSAELIAVPKGIAVYCRAIDETIGEIRIHYAGFVHPFFGVNRDDGGIGTPLIFEVRGHGIGVSLRHKEKLARLTFYRLSEDADGGSSSSYNDQGLQLSKFFGAWE